MLFFIALSLHTTASSKYYKGDGYQFIGTETDGNLILLGVHESNGNLVFIEGTKSDGKLTGNWWGVVDGRAKTGGKIIFSDSGSSLIKIYSKNPSPVTDLKSLAGSIWKDFDRASVSHHGNLGGSWTNDGGVTFHILDTGKKLCMAYCNPSGETISISNGCEETLTSFKCTLTKVFGSADLPFPSVEIQQSGGKLHEKTSNRFFEKKAATPVVSGSETDDIEEGTEEADEETSPEGPSSFTVSVSEFFRHDYENLSASDFTDINLDLFKDANPKSGYYYYIPNHYALNWSETNGFGIQVNYLGSSSGEAIVSAELYHNISQLEEELVRGLMGQQSTNSEEPFAQLQALPYESARLEVPSLSLYGVQSSDISISIPHSSFAPINISWKMSRVDDFLAALFSGVGLSGNLVLSSSGPLGNVNVPVNLKIDDPTTFGKINLDQRNWRNQKWDNTLPYPIVANALHIMIDEGTDSEPLFRIYTWETGGLEIPRDGSARFEADKVPVWLDSYNKVREMWISYTVPSCEYCKAGIIDEVVGGTVDRRDKAIEIETINPFEFTGARIIDVRLRSLQADPKGLVKKEMETVRLEDDFQVVTGGSLYPPEGESAKFEYFLKIYMEDGRSYSSDRWIEVDDYRLVIGTYQIKQSVSTFPK